MEQEKRLLFEPDMKLLTVETVLKGKKVFDTVNWKVGLTPKKRCRNATIVLSIFMKNEIDPSNFFHFSVWPLKIFEFKGG